MTTAKDLKAHAAAKRFARETGGCVWNGWPVATDRESRAAMLGEHLALTETVRKDGDRWKFSDGVFRALTNEQFHALSHAVLAHVRRSFAIEADAVTRIDAGEITTVEQIDAAFSGG